MKEEKVDAEEIGKEMRGSRRGPMSPAATRDG